jgi:hypothetical protein
MFERTLDKELFINNPLPPKTPPKPILPNRIYKRPMIPERPRPLSSLDVTRK